MTLDTVWHDLPGMDFALGALIPVPSIAVAALALGIGANATIFSVVETVLLRPRVRRQSYKMVGKLTRSCFRCDEKPAPQPPIVKGADGTGASVAHRDDEH